jgi:hypothetical protein
MIAHNPLPRSGRAGFPHPTLTSGNDAHAAQELRRNIRAQKAANVQSDAASGPRECGLSDYGATGSGPKPSHLELKHIQASSFISTP